MNFIWVTNSRTGEQIIVAIDKITHVEAIAGSLDAGIYLTSAVYIHCKESFREVLTALNRFAQIWPIDLSDTKEKVPDA